MMKHTKSVVRHSGFWGKSPICLKLSELFSGFLHIQTISDYRSFDLSRYPQIRADYLVIPVGFANIIVLICNGIIGVIVAAFGSQAILR